MITPPTCLIVDDSATVRRIVVPIVSTFGFACAEAENGRAALEACRKRMPEAILLDWNMPVMDGFHFLNALRREVNGAQPVVIFCTVENDIAQIRRAMESGANEYIMKPFDVATMRNKFIQTGLLSHE